MPSSWLHVRLRLNNKPTGWLTEKLVSKVLGVNEARFSQRRVIDAIRTLLSGDVGLYVTASDDTGLFPTGSIVATQANAAGDTLTFTYRGMAVVLTEGAAGKGGWSRGATDAEAGANLAAAITRHPVLGGILYATAVGGTVTLTGKVPGVIMHSIVITTNDGTAFALTQLSGGTEGGAALFLQNVWTGRV